MYLLKFYRVLTVDEFRCFQPVAVGFEAIVDPCFKSS